MHDTSFFIDLITIFGAATFVATLCHYLKMPSIVGFIIAGILVGPHGLGLVASLPNADNVAEIAIIFLMFTLGLEFSFKKMRELRDEFLQLGLVKVMVTTVLIALAAYSMLGSPLNKSIFLGFIFSLSSTALVLKLLQDSRELETPYGKGSLSVLIFEDVAVIPMMLALPLLAGQGEDFVPFTWREGLFWALQMVINLFCLWAGSRYVIPFILEKVVKTRSREIFFFCVLFLCLGIAYVFQLSGLSLSLGAFAAGMMISEGPYGRQVASDILPLRDNFLSLFFASVGMLLDLHFIANHILMITAIIAVLFTAKVTGVIVACVVRRTPFSVSAIMSLILCQIGEFSFILAAEGVDLGILTRQEYQYFLASSVLSMVFTPFLFLLAPKLAMSKIFTRWQAIASLGPGARIRESVTRQSLIEVPAAASTGRHTAHGKTKRQDVAHTIVIGFGIAGQNLAGAMRSLDIPFKVVELNYEVVKKLQQEGVDIHFGDATRREVLEHIGIATARLVVIAVSGAKIVPHIISAVRAMRPDVQIIVRSQYVRDIELIKKEATTDIVIAEIETAIELLARALIVYGVESEEIRNYMTQARKQLTTFSRMTSSLQSPTINLPSWEAIASIKPFRIGQTFASVDKALSELDLPRRTGTSMVSVFREGLGTTIPDGSFVLKAGDVTHLIGSPEALATAEILLKEGKIEQVS